LLRCFFSRGREWFRACHFRRVRRSPTGGESRRDLHHPVWGTGVSSELEKRPSGDRGSRQTKPAGDGGPRDWTRGPGRPRGRCLLAPGGKCFRPGGGGGPIGLKPGNRGKKNGAGPGVGSSIVGPHPPTFSAFPWGRSAVHSPPRIAGRRACGKTAQVGNSSEGPQRQLPTRNEGD